MATTNSCATGRKMRRPDNQHKKDPGGKSTDRVYGQNKILFLDNRILPFRSRHVMIPVS